MKKLIYVILNCLFSVALGMKAPHFSSIDDLPGWAVSLVGQIIQHRKQGWETYYYVLRYPGERKQAELWKEFMEFATNNVENTWNKGRYNFYVCCKLHLTIESPQSIGYSQQDLPILMEAVLKRLDNFKQQWLLIENYNDSGKECLLLNNQNDYNLFDKLKIIDFGQSLTAAFLPLHNKVKWMERERSIQIEVKKESFIKFQEIFNFTIDFSKVSDQLRRFLRVKNKEQ